MFSDLKKGLFFVKRCKKPAVRLVFRGKACYFIPYNDEEKIIQNDMEKNDVRKHPV